MQNPFVVAKFGGTSVANLNAICQCAEIIKSSPSVRVVVVSAQSGITNLLVKLAHHVKSVHEISGIVDDTGSMYAPNGGEYYSIPKVSSRKRTSS